jgi:hypothetical protein
MLSLAAVSLLIGCRPLPKHYRVPIEQPALHRHQLCGWPSLLMGPKVPKVCWLSYVSMDASG